MSSKKQQHTYRLIMILSCIFLLAAGLSRFLETDSGNILIHDIEIENYEGFFYGGRLFRPLQASSMNQRPSILIIPGAAADRYTGDHIAMEFARRGFVVLTIEDFSQGTTAPRPDGETESLTDAGYSFLTTRSFTDHSRTGLITFYSGAEKALRAENLSNFSAVVFVCPNFQTDPEEVFPEARIFTAAYAPQIPESIRNETFSSTKFGMLFHPNVLSALLEHFHEKLAIPNDSPFWFDAGSQHAQILLILRAALLFLLIWICCELGVLITGKIRHGITAGLTGVLIPLVLFFAVEEFMNFFLISVRSGLPYHYLPRISATKLPASPVWFIIPAICFLSAVRFGKNGKATVSDLLILCGLAVFLIRLLSTVIPGAGVFNFPESTGCGTVFYAGFCCSCLESLLQRLSFNKVSRCAAAILTGIIFYYLCCGLPTASLF